MRKYLLIVREGDVEVRRQVLFVGGIAFTSHGSGHSHLVETALPPGTANLADNEG